MNTIFKIAKAELAQLFYSPIAWFLMIAFLFQSGFAYYDAMDFYITRKELGGENLLYLTNMTNKIFAPPNGILQLLVYKLYLYLPLLTMGLMSREINGGTIKLLYSSPVRIQEIVFGKYLSMMIYNVVLIGILAIIELAGLFNIHQADAGLLIAGLLGVYLLLCAYAAIGLFMSSLTSYQVIAALGTLILLSLLNYINFLWQDIDFVRDLTYFLSIAGRTDKMLSGLISTKDLFYFMIIIFMFLEFCISKLRFDREAKPVFVRIRTYLFIFLGGLAIGYVSSRPGLIGYLDTTARKSMSLTANAQKIIRETGDLPIAITTYVNLLDNRFWYGLPSQRNTDMNRWEPYLRYKPDIHFKYVYFYDSTGDKDLYRYNPGVGMPQLAERYAKSVKMDLNFFKTPKEIRKEIDLRPEQNRYVMQLKYKDRSTFLRLFDDQDIFPSETETSAAIKRLLNAKLPRIAFLQGELERRIDKTGDRHYKLLTNQITFRYSLINQGFDVQTVSLASQDIPNDIAALVIADPKTPFDSASLAKIDKYIASGGNLLIAGEPGNAGVLNPLLGPLGIHLEEGILMQPSLNFSPDLIQASLTTAAAGLTKNLRYDTEDSLVLTMNGAAALSCDTTGAFRVMPLILTPAKQSWNKQNTPDTKQIQSAADDDTPSNTGIEDPSSIGLSRRDTGKQHVSGKRGVGFSPAEGDRPGPLPAVVALTRTIHGKQQRIVVSGDADFLSNLELARQNIRTCNFDFSIGLFSWFSYGEYPIDTSRPKPLDNDIRITASGMNLLRIVLIGVLPGLLLLAGTILLIRRKRK